jgi:uncharacterized spore protein YtfJ
MTEEKRAATRRQQDLRPFFREALHRFRSSGSADTVFGTARRENGRTVIPVAKIAFGFGGGWGNSDPKAAKRAARRRRASADQGVGGGGGIRIKPVGVIEVSSTGTRFLPVPGLLGALAAAGILGLMIGMSAGASASGAPRNGHGGPGGGPGDRRRGPRPVPGEGRRGPKPHMGEHRRGWRPDTSWSPEGRAPGAKTPTESGPADAKARADLKAQPDADRPSSERPTAARQPSL